MKALTHLDSLYGSEYFDPTFLLFVKTTSTACNRRTKIKNIRCINPTCPDCIKIKEEILNQPLWVNSPQIVKAKKERDQKWGQEKIKIIERTEEAMKRWSA